MFKGGDNGSEPDLGDLMNTKNPRNTLIQLGLSIAIGFGAFIAFCVCLHGFVDLEAAH